MSRQKQKGTAFETACARYLSRELGERVERRALHGSRDMGDLYGIFAHGHAGIAECKDHKAQTPSLVAEWRRQTADERDNADADFALLIIHTPGAGQKGFGRNRVDVTQRDLARIAGLPEPPGWADGVWVTLDLETAVALMCGAARG